jgi:dephospho-CoA kinase
VSIKDINMKVSFAVTGGVASGKTTVALMFEQHGVKTIDFDVLSRCVVEPEKPAWHDIVAVFGKEILNPDGTIDRAKLADIVFQDPARRRELEMIVHPPAFDEFLHRLEQILANDPKTVIQAEVPLLYETRMEAIAGLVVVVYCPESVQLERMTARDRISADQALRIIRAQLPIEKKKSIADIVIDNSGSIDQTRTQVETAWRNIENGLSHQ